MQGIESDLGASQALEPLAVGRVEGTRAAPQVEGLAAPAQTPVEVTQVTEGLVQLRAILKVSGERCGELARAAPDQG